MNFMNISFFNHNRGDFMFYDRFLQLCAQRGISPSKAAVEAGISKSLVTKWRTNAVQVPSAEVLQKLARYFSLSVSDLLEETAGAPAQPGVPAVSEEDIKFALFGGDGEITDAMYEEVKRFAAFVKQREAEKKE